MTRPQRFLVFILPFLGGLLPVLVYWMEHGGLGTPTFADFRDIDQAQQIAQVVAGLYIKPLYMFVSFALIIRLLRETGREMVSLLWGLIAFLIGETFCGINFIIYKHASLSSEYIHSYGMVLAFGLFVYAFLEILDRRLFHVNAGHCALNGLCQTCKRPTPLHCAARRLAILTTILASIAAFLPLAVSASPESYRVTLFGFPYSYARFDFYQWYETRALPLSALVLFVLALIPLFRGTGDPIPQATKILFSAGLGALGFSLFRLTLASVFANNLVWFEFWEELTELMFIAAISFILWQFRHTLTAKRSLS